MLSFGIRGLLLIDMSRSSEHYRRNKSEICRRRREKRITDPEWRDAVNEQKRIWYHSRLEHNRAKGRIRTKRYKERMKKQPNTKEHDPPDGWWVDSYIHDRRINNYAMSGDGYAERSMPKPSTKGQ